METQVVVIGGGITGTGIIRDLAMRGISVILVEKGDLANGTSARFHGLLHSGARYAVNDPNSARECIMENAILKKIAPHCIENTGGIFLELQGDDSAYVEKWRFACRETGISYQEIDPQELTKKEPLLSRNIRRAFQVPDAAVDGFKLVLENIASAKKYGAKIFTYTQVVSISVSSGKVIGVTVRKPTGETEFIFCQMVINAGGPWAGEIAKLVGLNLNLILNKGALLVFNRRLTGTIINRCQEPGDGDILVPHHSISIYGTTSIDVKEADCDRVDYWEVKKLLALGQKMFPSLGEARIIRAFAGVRPLYQSGEKIEGNQGREVTRDFFILDHESIDGLSGFISVIGGKFTTYRLMAEKTGDLAVKKLGKNSPCRTYQEILPGHFNADSKRKLKVEDKLICECEQIRESQLKEAIINDGCFDLNDLRRRTRLGMGTCQGTFCTYRALNVLKNYLPSEEMDLDPVLLNFYKERWKGMQPVFWGSTIKEGELMRRIYADFLAGEGGVERNEQNP
ncbi:MAG: anaerobic glycerol-3-phosphate dehydrogenase subunit A [Bacillota bacterium]|jgi:glycerol-3-phosphate dehydrogenase